MSFFDTGARRDPLVVGINHARQIVVGEDSARDVVSTSRDGGSDPWNGKRGRIHRESTAAVIGPSVTTLARAVYGDAVRARTKLSREEQFHKRDMKGDVCRPTRRGVYARWSFEPKDVVLAESS